MVESKLEKGIRILKIRQAMLKNGIPMINWPALPRYDTVKNVTRKGKRNPSAPKYTWAPWGTKGSFTTTVTIMLLDHTPIRELRRAFLV